MIEERRNRWMIWAIVALAIMNISTLATVFYNRNNSSAEEVPVNISSLTEPETTSIEYSGHYFRDNLNLNRYQMDRFSQFNPPFRQQARNINTNLKKIRHRILSEMAAENSDINRLNILSDSLGILHSDLKKITTQYYLNIKELCNQEQKEKLEQMFLKMYIGNESNERNKSRGQPGRGYGRRLNNFNN